MIWSFEKAHVLNILAADLGVYNIKKQASRLILRLKVKTKQMSRKEVSEWLGHWATKGAVICDKKVAFAKTIQL